jgi:nicotinate-nucleotide adenylyltransferase
MLDPHSCTRLIVYGGTFDPPHVAHVRLPFAAAEQIRADGVLYVPAGRPPHKPDEDRTPAPHRLAMLRLALGERDDAAICTCELDRNGPSYTWQTLAHLRESLGRAIELRLLIGMDMALIFHQWQQPGRICELADPLVMLRPPHDARRFIQALPDPWRAFWRERIVPVPALDVASLRRALARGDRTAAEPWLDREVLDYIAQQRLYAR